MQSLIVYGIIAAVLFAVPFIFGRRFGVLAMALAVGAILSDVWTNELISLARGVGISIELYGPMMVSVLIILAPVLILMFKSCHVRPLFLRLFGSFMFMILALAFLIEPLGRYFVVQGLGSEMFNLFYEKRHLVIGVGLILAIFDFLLAKFGKKHQDLAIKGHNH